MSVARREYSLSNGHDRLGFTVLFWNIWQQNQWHETRFMRLQTRLETIINTLHPDVIGLNEVISEDETPVKSNVLALLRQYCYDTHYIPFGRDKKGLLTGSALAARKPILGTEILRLGTDTTVQASNSAHGTCLLLADIAVNHRQNVRIGINHFAHLVPRNWREHIRNWHALQAFVAQPRQQQRTIIGGDFNQFKFLTSRTKLPKHMHRATGSWRTPTWRLGGSRLSLFNANYDHVFWSKCATFNLRHFAVLPRHPSDHSPLIAQFELMHQ